MSKIILATEYISDSENSTGYFWSKILKGLNDNKIECSVISSSIHAKNKESLEECEFFYIPGGDYNKSSIFLRFLGQFLLVFKYAFYALTKSSRGDLLVTGTNPSLLVLVLPLLVKLKRLKWIMLVHDVYPDALACSNVISREGFFYRALDKYYAWVYSSASLLIVIGRDMKSLMEQKTNNLANVTYVPNWVDADDIIPIKKENSKILNSNLNYSFNKLVFQFFGNLGRLQGIDNLIEGIKLVKNDNVSFIFIGDGVYKDKIKNFSNESSNVLYLSALPQSKRSEGLAACDISIISLNAGMYGVGVPSKAYFSMAANKKMLAIMDIDSEIAQMVNEHNLGWVCPPDSPAELAAMIDKIASNYQEESFSRVVLEQNFSAEILIRRVIDEIIKVASQ